MAKGYWVSIYRSIRDENALSAYAKLAIPAIDAAGGRVIARGMPARVYEAGLQQRIVIVEYASVAAAIAARESVGYQAALRALGDGAERDFRIIEGVD